MGKRRRSSTSSAESSTSSATSDSDFSERHRSRHRERSKKKHRTRDRPPRNSSSSPKKQSQSSKQHHSTHVKKKTENRHKSEKGHCQEQTCTSRNNHAEAKTSKSSSHKQRCYRKRSETSYSSDSGDSTGGDGKRYIQERRLKQDTIEQCIDSSPELRIPRLSKKEKSNNDSKNGMDKSKINHDLIKATPDAKNKRNDEKPLVEPVQSATAAKPSRKDVPKAKEQPSIDETKISKKVKKDRSKTPTTDPQAVTQKIEQAMVKRREKIERWRKGRKKYADDSSYSSDYRKPSKTGDEWFSEDESTKAPEKNEEPVQVAKKEAEAAEAVPAEEEPDPLDEYMMMISEEMKAINAGSRTKKGQSEPVEKTEAVTPANDNPKKAVIVRTNVQEKGPDKGYIMEQDADALEYSSEEVSDDDDLFMSRKSKADCINTDHNKIYYRKFRKRFYSEVPEIARMTKEEVAQYRQELDNIQVTGKKCPKPIKTWAQCVTYLSILDALKRFGMQKPTPIQAQALPIICSGRDMLGIAKTGSGKTLAFLLPMFRHIKAQPPLEAEDGPVGLVVTPTRELAMQIAKECRRFCKLLDLRVVAVYGGTGISEQIADLKRGTEIVVCTPGRMIDMLAANNGKVTNLRRVTYVVIDEADRMFDMGFEPQVNKILECVRPDRQTVMFSATFPRQMEALARRALRKPVEVVVGGRSVVCEDVEQQVVILNEDQKYLKLLELLGIYHEHGSVLVFVHKQEHADELMKNLMQSSYPCLALHGGIDQYDRDSVISDFKSGAIRLLIATSVAARGLDVRHLILVVNYDCPNHYEDYVHRCGRTGRAGKRGVAYTFITPYQGKLAGEVIKALEQSNVEVSEELRQLWDAYKQKMEEEGVKIKTGTGGFGGKGFRFDNEEQAFLDDRKRVQKVMFGMQDSDDEDCVDIDHEIDKTFKSRTRVKNPGMVEGIVMGDGGAGEEVKQTTNAEKLAFAKVLAARISQNRGDVRDILNPIGTGIPPASFGLSGKSIAEQIAGKLNSKLNYVPKERDQDSEHDEVKVYEEELEINDFPQNARWKVTSKETLGHIAEYAEAALTVRGRYFPPGKNPPPGESRLYLIIEALTERGLQLAKAEIKRIIKEEMMKMQNPALQMVNRGRYRVL